MAKRQARPQPRGKKRGSVDDETLRKNIQRKLANDPFTVPRQRRNAVHPADNRPIGRAVLGPTRASESDMNIAVSEEGYPGQFVGAEVRERGFRRGGRGNRGRHRGSSRNHTPGQRRRRSKGRKGIFPGNRGSR